MRNLLLLLIGLFLIAAAFLFWAWQDYRAPGPLAQEKTLIFAPGTGLKAMTRQLEEAGVIGHSLPAQFGTLWEGKAKSLKAGEYAFAPGISAQGAMTMIAEGRVVIHKVTVPEGWNVREVMAALMQEDALTGDAPQAVSEGSLLPETYYFNRGDTRAALVERMQMAMKKTVAELWAKHREDSPITTPEQAVILASVVEKETGLAEERPRVAAVFINRLKQGIKLQSDPTVAYGIEQKTGMAFKRPLFLPDLRNETPYNTYVIDGLPPAPICNPGRASVQAAMNPPDSNELYFVATGTGGHRFAATLEEHNANVAAYRAGQKAVTP